LLVVGPGLSTTFLEAPCLGPQGRLTTVPQAGSDAVQTAIGSADQRRDHHPNCPSRLGVAVVAGAGEKTMNVVRLKITNAGRQALA
jgi:hypothetical protein